MLDGENRVYIIYPLSKLQEDIGYSRHTVIDSMSELEEIGLIQKLQIKGKPTVIYLKNFASVENEISDPGNIGVKTTENSGSRPSENRVLDHGKSDTNNTYRVISTNPISSMGQELNDEYNAYAEIIKENLALDIMLERYPSEKEIVEGIYDLILETVLCKNPTIWISKNEYPSNLVKSKFLKLNNMHLEYVMDCMKNNTTKIRNIKNYLLSALFNAPTTMGSYYQSEVSHDMACGAV